MTESNRPDTLRNTGLLWLSDDGTLVIEVPLAANGSTQERMFFEYSPEDARFKKIAALVGLPAQDENLLLGEEMIALIFAE
ncbi:MAG: hypothetical protein K2Y39_11405 [Candidatus Obscuribacterales bacterium]|nr:hypothetical protein [Candidatus Obscuribacterales bacterium]